MESLGCPKAEVDASKLSGVVEAEGYLPARDPSAADLIVVNTCAFIEAARAESVEKILELDQVRIPGSRLVVTGCLAERYGQQLAEALPEVDLVAPFGVSPLERSPVRFTKRPTLDLLELKRPPATAPWAYVKIAEGCDRRCGFCAIPTFRGPQHSREVSAILEEIEELLASGVQEIVLVAQDPVSFNKDRSSFSTSERPLPSPLAREQNGKDGEERADLARLIESASALAPWVRVLYLYPTGLDERLIEVIARDGLAYFDLSLQHASRSLLHAMGRPGGSDWFLERLGVIREVAPDATLRSSFVIGYPGETEADHQELLSFLQEARLHWAGFFPFSAEEGTRAASMNNQVPHELAMERVRECEELQAEITTALQLARLGTQMEVLVTEPGHARSAKEAPDVDAEIRVPRELRVGGFSVVEARSLEGLDLYAVAVEEPTAHVEHGGGTRDA
jgi:ribosomal protein S12 methylthiotransferase